MIITDVEAIHVRPDTLDASIADGTQDALIIRVHTDEGIVGLGEVDSMPSVVKAVVDAPPTHRLASGLRALLVGEDPLDTTRLWHKMFDGSLYFGRRGAVMHAISGIDIALWDIAGKAAGVPVHELLGGARRVDVPAYASTLMPESPEEAAAAVRRQLDNGFTAVKLGYGPLGSDAELDVALVAAARQAAGADVDLMIDIGLTWPTASEGIARARRMEEYRLTWIEEPFPPDDHDAYSALAAGTSIPLAAGEQEATCWDFERLMDECGVRVVQPDVTRAGGITESMRIAQAVRRRGLRCVPHAFSTGLIKAATLQVIAVLEEAEFLEYSVQSTPLSTGLTQESFPVVDGRIQIPTGPGLGVTLDEDMLAAYRLDRPRS